MRADQFYEGSLLETATGAWRSAKAHRFAPLMENKAYFDALASALHKAERSILILGWQFDPRTRLDPEGPLNDRRAEIGHQLKALVRHKPDLDVRLLIWRSPLLIAASQGFYPHKAQRWFRRRIVEFRLDGPGILGACHHQKVVVIDNQIAFCGGGDISTDRWDTEEHFSGDPRRCEPTGVIPAPRHEVMCVMDGPAAQALGELARERWRRATGEVIAPIMAQCADSWPERVTPALTQVSVGISRTEPQVRGRPEVRENEALHLEAIRRARSLIYMENQYFTSPLLAAALAERLAEPDGPEVVLVSTGRSPSWFDGLTMDTARAEVLYRLEQADRHDRFTAFYPVTDEGERIIVHAKMTIVDDKLLRIGSSNLNNRSMGLDTECDVSVEAETEEQREVIQRFRRHSLGHFIGVSGEAFAEAETLLGSVGQAIQTFGHERMKPLGATEPTRVERMFAEWQFGDPMSSTDAWRPWKRLNRSHRTRPRSEGGQAPG
ncbi:phospholipase D-like domain-containing protein [Brevundimonas sp.]|uniref:phospholipase D-like domain-containing protein n=1 Tax=Brevundimonas sp. TaxID=1871086 RepID=UPI0028AD8495|nr:phospholipase D-like domain-containing protein [Brevundimonas sp.]